MSEMEAVAELRKIRGETEPEKLRDLSPGRLESYHDRLSKIFWELQDQRQKEQCKARMREIEMIQIQKRSEHQHQESRGIGKKGLFWSRIAGVGAIVLIM